MRQAREKQHGPGMEALPSLPPAPLRRRHRSRCRRLFCRISALSSQNSSPFLHMQEGKKEKMLAERPDCGHWHPLTKCLPGHPPNLFILKHTSVSGGDCRPPHVRGDSGVCPWGHRRGSTGGLELTPEAMQPAGVGAPYPRHSRGHQAPREHVIQEAQVPGFPRPQVAAW